MYKDPAIAKLKAKEYAAKRWADPVTGAHMRAVAKAWREKNKAHCQSRDRKRKGLPGPTRPEPAHCEICGWPPDRATLCADHDHLTGEFRGWLCHRCNSGIGLFQDEPARLRKAAVYLEVRK